MREVSYNSWPASPDPHAINLVHLDLPGHPNAFPPGVKSGDVATVLGYVARQLVARVQPFGEGCWGYSYRKNRNANNLSCHASGTAIDFRAPLHPNGVHGTWTAAQIAEVRKILVEVDYVVAWGEDFGGTVDGMHFEINDTPAKVAQVARKLTAVHASSHTPPAPVVVHAPQEARMIVQFTNELPVWEVVGSKLVHITKAAWDARGLKRSQVTVLPQTHALNHLPKEAA